MRSQSPIQADSKEVPLYKYRVLFPYTPQHDDELSINEGDLITVLHEVEEGWWKGVLNGQVGMFPSNFVEKIEEPTTVAQNKELNGNADNIGSKDQSGNINVSPDVQFSPKILGSPNSAFHPIHSKREERETKKDSLDSIYSNNKLDNAQLSKVRKTNSLETYRQSCEKDKITINVGEEINRRDKEVLTRIPSLPLDGNPPELPPKPVREMARVVFPYSADHDDELELNEGDVITVLCKELEDKGWWKGELNNKVGVFPDNFVELITVDEAVKPPRPEKRPTALPKPKHTSDVLPAKKKDTAPLPLPQSLKKSPALSHTKKADLRKDSTGSSDFSRDSIDGMMYEGKESLSLDRELHLIHQTQTRPKGPSNRRPPSQMFLDDKKTTVSDDEEMTALAEELVNKGQSSPNNSANDVPWMIELKANQMKKKLMGGPTADTALSGTPHCSFGVQTNPRRLSDLIPPTKTRTGAVSSMSDTAMKTRTSAGSSTSDTVIKTRISAGSSMSDITMKSRTSAGSSKVDNHINTSLAATNGFKDDFYLCQMDYDSIVNKVRAELSPQIKKLEERLTEQQQRHSRQLLMLMDELGEERQKIACLQIDIDRLSKLVSAEANV